MRRILQSQGAEVIHLGHNRSVDEVVTAAVQEDVQGVAVSSYQGGHVEYFEYLVDLLRERGAGHVKVYGGGGGVIVPDEIARLHDYGVARIFSPHDGHELGLVGMIDSMIEACDVDLAAELPATLDGLVAGEPSVLARVITGLEAGRLPERQVDEIGSLAGGTRRARAGHHRHRRIRQVVAHRRAGAALPARLRGQAEDRGAGHRSQPAQGRWGAARRPDPHERHRPVGGDVPLARHPHARRGGAGEPRCHRARPRRRPAPISSSSRRPGIGQGDAAIVDHVDTSLYVMTPEFGAASQLEKIDMLDFADVVAINKLDRRGGEDALRDVRRQMVRNTEAFGSAPDDMPVFGTIASRFNDDGVTALYQELRSRLVEHGLSVGGGALAPVDVKASTTGDAIVPPARVRYLAEVAETVRGYHRWVDEQAEVARRRQQLDVGPGDARRRLDRRRRRRGPAGRAAAAGRPRARCRGAGGARCLAGHGRGLLG